MIMDKGSILYKKARRNTIKCKNKIVDGKPIVEVFDKDDYYLGSCIPEYVYRFLDLAYIAYIIEKEYKRLLKEGNN